MPLKINVPPVAWSEQNVSLDGRLYRFVFSFNTRDRRWRMSIYYQGQEVVVGVKLMENQWLVTAPYYPDEFTHGDLICVRLREDSNPVGRGNLGFGKPYELLYYTMQEIAELLDEE